MISPRAFPSRLTTLISLCVSLSLCNCAVHYYDAETGTEHVWGFGHLKMRAPAAEEGCRAVATETELFGLGLGVREASLWGVAGWSKDARVTIMDENTSVRLEWPTHQLFDVRVGVDPPFAPGAFSEADVPTEREHP